MSDRSQPAAGLADRGGTVPVWPLWLRAMHWGLAASVIAAFATHEGGGAWHEWLGYAALAIAGLRVAVGLVSRDPHLRLDGFLHGPARTLAYARQVLARRAPRHLGHNPLGGWMMAVLLADALACGFTGWLFTTDRFFGVEWLEELHGALGEAFVPLVLLHVAGAVLASRSHGENLVRAMLTGRKRAPGPGDVP